jgi:ParB family chromosome partitioning protein
MASSKFNTNIKGRLASMANWSGGSVEEEDEAPQAFGEKLRKELELASAQTPIQEIALEQLLDNPYQHLARRQSDDESLEELVDSVKSNGFYGALLARRKAGATNRFELAYGHRRKEAARRAGLTTVPVKVVELNDTEMARIMASENFSRLDLDPLGEAGVVGFLATDQNLSAREIATIVGKKRGWVEQRLALYNAPKVIKEMVDQKPSSFSHIPLLLRLKSEPEKLKTLVKEVLISELTVQQLKERLESYQTSNLSGTPKDQKRTHQPSQEDSDNIVTNITNSNLIGNGEEYHKLPKTKKPKTPSLAASEADPFIRYYGKIIAGGEPEALFEEGQDEVELEAHLRLLENLVGQLAKRNFESLPWNVRSRLQSLSQTLKELVGGD